MDCVVKRARRSLRTRTGRDENADTHASSDGEATLRGGVTKRLVRRHNHPLVGGMLQTRTR